MTGRLILRTKGPAAEIVFDNPEKRNAVSLEMWEAAATALDRFAADDSVRVVILSGAGDRAFVSGADISKFESERAEAQAVERYNATTGRVYDGLYTFPKPVIAKIRGACVGGGINLAVCCDLRICAEGSRFGMPAARLGLGYGYERLQRLAQVVGLSNALEMGFTARLFSADEAYRMQLVNRVLPVDELEALVSNLAERIASNAPLSVATLKASAIELRKHESERRFDHIEAMVAACFSSEDYAEGRRAFMEKREPDFRGR